MKRSHLRIEPLESWRLLATMNLSDFDFVSDRQDLDLPAATANTSGIAMVPGTAARFTSPLPTTGEKQASFFVPI